MVMRMVVVEIFDTKMVRKTSMDVMMMFDNGDTRCLVVETSPCWSTPMTTTALLTLLMVGNFIKAFFVVIHTF